MKKTLRDYIYLALMAGVIVAVDQITKSIVRNNLGFREMWVPFDWLAPYARIVHWYNTGAAFGMFQGLSVVFTVLAFVVAGAIIYYYRFVPREDWTMRLAMGLQLGGALGNLVDRLTIGHVTDFISIGAFPVFNVADSSITVGVIVLVLGVWIQERREKAAAKAAPAETTEPVEPAPDIEQEKVL